MKRTEIITVAARNALCTVLYIAAVASAIFYVPRMFVPPDTKDIVLIPIAMLSLFVFSAALTAYLVLGKPVRWYLDGKKQEAFSLFAWTLGILFTITILIFVVLFLVQ